jgi:hypothetical protein
MRLYRYGPVACPLRAVSYSIDHRGYQLVGCPTQYEKVMPYSATLYASCLTHGVESCPIQLSR